MLYLSLESKDIDISCSNFAVKITKLPSCLTMSEMFNGAKHLYKGIFDANRPKYHHCIWWWLLVMDVKKYIIFWKL